MCYQSAIVHISDTEFGPNNRAKQKEIKKHYEKPYEQMMEDFMADVRTEIIDRYRITPQKIGLVISGDIADNGKDCEFRKAEKCINYVRRKIGIPKQQVAIVPGNHDVNWHDCSDAYQAELIKHNQDEKQIMEKIRSSPEKLAKFTSFLGRICRLKFRIQRPLLFKGFEKLGIALIGLDTTYPSLRTPKDNYGRIRVEQVQAAGSELRKWLKHKNQLIPIAIMHHSLLPNLENKKDKSYLRDSKKVRRWLKDAGFSIAMCGHEHTKESSSSISGHFKILITGSFGLCREKLEKGYKEDRRPETNKYQILLLNLDGESKLLYRRLNRSDTSYPLGKWEEDRSSGRSFDKVDLRQSDIPTYKQADLDLATIVDIGNPVESVSKEGRKRWIVALKINETTPILSRIKSVRYKIEPGGDEFKGDPCCHFLAALLLDQLVGWSVSARITFKNDTEIPVNINIPSVYSPSDYVLSAHYSTGTRSPSRMITEAFTVPTKRRKHPVERSKVPTEKYKPEPVLDTAEYEHILKVIRSMSLVIERSPGSFASLDEESIRTHFLFQLNGHYEGDATGETFNASGKTDILIRVENRNIFIAECKFWRGPKGFSAAIDQLLSYLSWRDSKCALIVFNRTRNSSAIREKMHKIMESRPEYRKTVIHEPDGDSRYILLKKSDPGREIVITTLLFDIPSD